MIKGPLHWLGMVDLARPAPQEAESAFHISPAATSLLDGIAPGDTPAETGTIQVSSSGKIRVSRLAPRPARYQLGRFGILIRVNEDVYTYQITPAALERARRQGLRTSHLIALLRRHSEAPVPVPLIQALERWEQHGVQARLEPLLILRVRSPEVIDALRRSRAGRFLGDLLGPTAVVVHTGARDKVLAALAELGYLAEVTMTDLSKPDEGIIS